MSSHLPNYLWRRFLAVCIPAVFSVTSGATYAQISNTPNTTYLIAGGQPAGAQDGVGSGAKFNFPIGAVQLSDRLLVADQGNHAIRRVGVTGSVLRFAGEYGQCGATNGPNTFVNTRFCGPTGIAVDSVGNLYITEKEHETIRKIGPQSQATGLFGPITTFAGTSKMKGSADGTGAAARFHTPTGIAIDFQDNIYVADTDNHTIRKITPAGVVSTIAGTAGKCGGADGTGTAAQFCGPTGIAVDAEGSVYVTDTRNGLIRVISSDGVVSTIAGGTPKVQCGYANGPGIDARFCGPSGIAVDTFGNLYVADTGNYVIRKITPSGTVSTVVGTPFPGANLFTAFALLTGSTAGVAVSVPGTLAGPIAPPLGVTIIGPDRLLITTIKSELVGANLSFEDF